MRYIHILIGILLLSACSKQAEVNDLNNDDFAPEIVMAESRKANAFFDLAFDQAVARSPEWQAHLGIKENYGIWDDKSDGAAFGNMKFYEGQLRLLRDSVDFKKLDGQTKVSYKLFEQFCQKAMDGYEWRNYSYPAHQMRGRHSDMPAFLINIHKIVSYKDALAYLSRLDGMPQAIDQLIEQLRANEKEGISPPKFVYPYVVEDCKNIISGKPFLGEGDNVIYADFVKKVDALDIEDKKKKALKMGCEKRLMSSVQPAYQRLIRFLQGQEAMAKTDDGVWKFPKGDAYYKYRLKEMTSTNMTAEEIHELGLAEVARIHKEMEVIMEQVEFEGTLREFFEFVRTDPQFYHENTEEGRRSYMTAAEGAIDGMRDRIDDLFLTKPKAELVVKRVEPFREQSAGKAFYQRPAADGSRPGIYYANTYDMSILPKYQMEALAFHEAIPGHHMQLSIAQELEDIPKFRRYAGHYTAYIEGWGLYSERLPKEIGFYKDPYSDFGRLAMELWRACRLVVDTGIHTKKWTRERGIDFYTENTPNSEADCIKMVERHIVMPGQATAYKIGMIKILELREKTKEQLGSKFDLREFHDVLLTNGAVPLDVLEDLVDEYVAKQQ